MTLKYENVAEVGDLIRGLDFEPDELRPDRYIEGVVLEKGVDGYTVRTTVDKYGDVYREGEKSRVGYKSLIPYEVLFMEFEGRVVNLTKNPEV